MLPQQPPEHPQKTVYLTPEKEQEPAWLLHVREGTEKPGPKANYERMGRQAWTGGRRNGAGGWPSIEF